MKRYDFYISFNDLFVVNFLDGNLCWKSFHQETTIHLTTPNSVVIFLPAKILLVVNLKFLIFKGLNVNIVRLFAPNELTDSIALLFLIIGTLILFLSTVKLKNRLIFF
jgi:hypothetical protein